MRKLIICFLVLSFLPLFASAHGGVDDDELIIRMTKSGFEPAELTVTQNDVVLFINNDEVPRWPLFSENAGAQVAPGSSTKLLFSKVGTFKVTDKLAPQAKLTVVSLADPANRPLTDGNDNVVTPSSPTSQSFWSKVKAFFSNLFHPPTKTLTGKVKIDQKVLAEFKALKDVDKYAWINKTGAREGPEVAWNYIVAAYTTADGSVIGNAHDMAHLVGQLLYKKYGFKGLATCTPTFAFGCYHGVMQVAFDKEKPAEFPARLAEAQEGCTGVAEATSPSYWSCIHGIGHGVATYRDFDLNKALADCDTLGASISTYCHDGVFMEFTTRAPESFYKTTDPIYPCNAIADSYKVGCARNQVQVMKQRFRMSDAQVAAVCLASGDNTITYHCIDALGYGIVQATGGDPRRIIQGCNVITDKTAAAQCLAAAAGELVFENVANWQKSAEIVCGSLEGEAHQACEARVASVKQSYGR